MKATDITPAEKTALCKQFGVPYPEDLSDEQLLHLAGTFNGATILIHMRATEFWKNFKKAFKRET